MTETQEIIATHKLYKPLKELDGTEIKELNFTELCVEDFIQYDQRELSKVSVVVEVTGRLTGTRKEVLKKLSAKDYLACSKIINDFFDDSPVIPT